jgi:Uma2 family endonuclease
MGLVLERDPDTVRGADICLYLEARRYEDLSIKFAERMPTLAVEVLSPHDRMGKVLRRVRLYLKQGVSMVWILDPEARNLTIYGPDNTYAVLESDEELANLDVLPGFRCRVGDFFAMPGEK